MTQHACIPSVTPTDIQPLLATARRAAGAAIDSAAMGHEGVELLTGLLKAIHALDDSGLITDIARAGLVIADFYLEPLSGMLADARALTDELQALQPSARQHTGGAA